MRLWFRPLEPPDIPDCLEMLYNRAIYSEEMLARLPTCWLRLLNSGAAIAMVFLDLDVVPGSQVVAFGLSVVITADFANHIRQHVALDIANFIMNALDSPHPPVLNRRTLGRENAQRGLNLLAMYFGFRRQEAADVRLIANKMIEGFNFMHFGYRWKEVLALVYGDIWKQGYLAGGWRMRVEAAEFYQEAPERLPAPPLRPYLLGLRMEEAGPDGDFTSRLAPVFSYHPPVFRFRRGERDLLQYALLGMSDEEIANRLCISLNTVKTRWRNIYTRVELCRDDFFPEAYGQKAVRGPARRPLLLRYLQDHLEELRPYDAI